LARRGARVWWCGRRACVGGLRGQRQQRAVQRRCAQRPGPGGWLALAARWRCARTTMSMRPGRCERPILTSRLVGVKLGTVGLSWLDSVTMKGLGLCPGILPGAGAQPEEAPVGKTM
jgi:hypothetical protein